MNEKITYEYLISDKYLSHWSALDGIREFIQNAYDADISSGESSARITKDDSRLYIVNKGTIEPETLLLGNGTKQNDKATSGEWGEGYKVGSLVVIRNGISVEIYDGKGSIYIPSIEYREDVKSNILVFTKYRDDNHIPGFVEVTLTNITTEIFKGVVNNTLRLKNEAQVNVNHILTDPNEQGRIYINGLYITTDPHFKYGYNFTSKTLQTNRDRNLVSNFELKWETSRLWNDTTITNKELIPIVVDMLQNETPDVQGITNTISISLAKEIQQYFASINSNKLPISSDADKYTYRSRGYANSTYTHVSATMHSILKQSGAYTMPMHKSSLRLPKNAKPIDLLVAFDTAFNAEISETAKQSLAEIIEISRNWKYKPKKNGKEPS